MAGERHVAASRYDDVMLDTQSTHSADAWLRAARDRIDAIDAELLLAHALGCERTWLYAHRTDAVPCAAGAAFASLLARREAGEPVAHLVGRRGFWTLDLAVTADTLIPRPETERLVELALERIPAETRAHVADLGTGSGAIALALASERPRSRIVAVDRSEPALAVARTNATAAGIANVEFRRGDWFEPLHGERFDVIVSNPPYIADGDPHLEHGDLRYEPMIALASGHDGLDAIREIVIHARPHLADGGLLLLEHGWTQGAAVRALLSTEGFTDVVTERDLEDRDRVTLGRSIAGKPL